MFFCRKRLVARCISLLLSFILLLQGYVFYSDGKNANDVPLESFAETLMDLFGSEDSEDLFIHLASTPENEDTQSEEESPDHDDVKIYGSHPYESHLFDPWPINTPFPALLILKSRICKIPTPPPELSDHLV